MKVSVSLSDADLKFVDEQTDSGLFASRSAAVQAAIRLLRDRTYTDSYAAAWSEWDDSGDSAMWEPTTEDGLR